MLVTKSFPNAESVIAIQSCSADLTIVSGNSCGHQSSWRCRMSATSSAVVRSGRLVFLKLAIARSEFRACRIFLQFVAGLLCVIVEHLDRLKRIIVEVLAH